MNPTVNLRILGQQFLLLSKSAFFDPEFRSFATKTYEAISYVVATSDKFADEILREFERRAWHVLKFIKGSRAKDAPHETQYVLRKALRDWVKKDALISSAALSELEFFFSPYSFWDFVVNSIPQYNPEGYNPLVVQIGSPEAYKHKPIFCIPLFHELGHFVEHSYQIIGLSMLLSPPSSPPSNMNPQIWSKLNYNHRMEHFADLFCASYCGSASGLSLYAIAPYNGDSFTHPATQTRISIVEDFLNSRDNSMISLIQNACVARTGRKLEINYRKPNLSDCFDDVLTYRIIDDSELYGIFLAAWEYLEKQLSVRSAPWVSSDLSLFDIERTINDLVEKSIRNYEIRERWGDEPAN